MRLDPSLPPEGFHELGLEGGLGRGEVFRDRFVFFPEFGGFAKFHLRFVRVLAVEVVVALREFLRAHLPGVLGLLPAAARLATPPGLLAVELADRERLRL